MRRVLVLVAGCWALVTGGCSRAPTPAPVPSNQPPATSNQHPVPSPQQPTPRFYHGFPYGSEAGFNPLSIVIDEGFDQIRTSPRRNIADFPYGDSFAAVVRSVVRPDRPIRRYGFGNWIRDEVLPLSTRGAGGGQWYPNYTLHLFGSGVTYVRMADWYALHGAAAHPRLAAGITVFAYHFLNELNENGPHADDGVDALTDLLVFDPASVLLWNMDWTQRLFSERLTVSTWQGQPSWSVPGHTIENAFSMVMLRAPVPRTRDWGLLLTQGNAFLAGVSRRVGDSSWVTIGAGADAPANPVIDTVTGKKTAVLQRNMGVFVDRNGSLLASFIARGGSDIGATINVYPGVLGVGRVHPGLWVQQNRGGGMRFGIVGRVGLGISTSAGTR
jgi:hypothetical protein